jgi:hypothetical protein
MALTSYSTLKTAVANYLGRSDLTSQIPDFITLAELRLSREIRTRKLLKSVTTTTTAGDSTVALPSDFQQLRDIYLDGNPRISLQYLSPSTFTRNAQATVSGKPAVYTTLAQEFEFAPIPDKAYTVELLYYFKPVAMSDSVASNEFLANYPDALLYASLAEAEPYLMNDARIQVWSSMYDRAIANISVSDEDSEFSAVPLQMSVTTR